MTENRAGELREEALDEVEPGAMLGREGELEAAGRACGEPRFGFLGYVGRVIVEDELDGGAGRISGIEKLEEFDELSTAMAILDKGVNLAGEQINSRQQAERAMALVFMITREGRVDAWHGRQIRRRRGDGLDSWLFVVGDDRHRLAGFVWLVGRHLLLKLGVPALQVVAPLMRLDFFPVENLTDGALNQLGQTPVSRRRPMLARMACQKARGPQFVRIAVLLGLVARQGNQPSLGLRRDGWLFARSRSVVERHQVPIGQRSFAAALDRLVMASDLSCSRKKRWVLPVGEKHLRPLHPARRLRARTRYRRQPRNFLVGHRQLNHLTPSCHLGNPRHVHYKRGIRQDSSGSTRHRLSSTSGFKESVV